METLQPGDVTVEDLVKSTGRGRTYLRRKLDELVKKGAIDKVIIKNSYGRDGTIYRKSKNAGKNAIGMPWDD